MSTDLSDRSKTRTQRINKDLNHSNNRWRSYCCLKAKIERMRRCLFPSGDFKNTS